MNARIWVASDHHLGHTNTWAKFKREDGSPLRPFKSDEEMDETMIARHNAVVKPEDHVYFLGDVVINKRNLEKVKRFMGHKRLVRGNHDIFKTKQYLDVGFDEIYGVRVFLPNDQQKIPGAILSHIPLHPESVQRWAVNVHGHLHGNIVRDEKKWPDPRYVCVCVEQIDYTPVLLDTILRHRSNMYVSPEQRMFIRGAD